MQSCAIGRKRCAGAVGGFVGGQKIAEQRVFRLE
jgi:hypothetical protein